MRKIFTIALLALLLAGCVGEEVKLTASPEVLYNRAVAAVNDRNYPEAKKITEFIRTEYPFSPYSVESELLEAESLFKQESYLAAIEAFGSFEELHPFHEKAAYALFRRGECNYELMGSSDRDMTYAHETALIMDRFIKSNPQSPYAAKAQEKLLSAIDLMAEHEMYVARFYIKKGKYEAALGRLKMLIDNYPESSSRNEALKIVDDIKRRVEVKSGG